MLLLRSLLFNLFLYTGIVAVFLIAKIIYIKKSNNKNFIVLDAGMNDLMRPALYDVQHQIVPIKKTNKLFRGNFEFVGPICESSDKFSNQKIFHKLKKVTMWA